MTVLWLRPKHSLTSATILRCADVLLETYSGGLFALKDLYSGTYQHHWPSVHDDNQLLTIRTALLNEKTELVLSVSSGEAHFYELSALVESSMQLTEDPEKHISSAKQDLFPKRFGAPGAPECFEASRSILEHPGALPTRVGCPVQIICPRDKA